MWQTTVQPISPELGNSQQHNLYEYILQVRGKICGFFFILDEISLLRLENLDISFHLIFFSHVLLHLTVRVSTLAWRAQCCYLQLETKTKMILKTGKHLS